MVIRTGQSMPYGTTTLYKPVYRVLLVLMELRFQLLTSRDLPNRGTGHVLLEPILSLMNRRLPPRPVV